MFINSKLNKGKEALKAPFKLLCILHCRLTSKNNVTIHVRTLSMYQRILMMKIQFTDWIQQLFTVKPFSSLWFPVQVKWVS